MSVCLSVCPSFSAVTAPHGEGNQSLSDFAVILQAIHKVMNIVQCWNTLISLCSKSSLPDHKNHFGLNIGPEMGPWVILYLLLRMWVTFYSHSAYIQITFLTCQG